MVPHAGELAALGTAFCWTATSVAFELAGRRIGSLSVNLIRLVLGAILLALWGLAFRGQAWPSGLTAHHWLWLGLSGVVGFAIGDLCLFRAFVVLGARLSMLIMSLVPPITALLGFTLLGETLEPHEWVGMALTLGGVSWVIRERTPSPDGHAVGPSTRGVLLGLGGALGQALGLVLSKHGMQELDAFAANQIRVLAGIVAFGVLFVPLGWWPRVVGALRDRPALGWTATGAFFGPFLGVSLSLLAVRLTETGVAATIMSIVPVIILPVALARGERVTLRATAGAILAVGGCALLFLG